MVKTDADQDLLCVVSRVDGSVAIGNFDYERKDPPVQSIDISSNLRFTYLHKIRKKAISTDTSFIYGYETKIFFF